MRIRRITLRKPSDWWAFEREPWKRIGAEIRAAEKAAADREKAERAIKAHSPVPRWGWCVPAHA
jgi:hypothetical protein